MKEFKCPMCGKMISGCITIRELPTRATYKKIGYYGTGIIDYDCTGYECNENFKCEECGELIATSEEQLIDLFKG